MYILVTGGAGYIGSHTIIELHKAGYKFIVYDNLSNSFQESLCRVEKIINESIIFIQGDIRDINELSNLFEKYNIDSVIHFAGLKAVGESIIEPLKYYDNNINGTLILLQVMKKYNCKKIVFSSSATVYGAQEQNPIKESFLTGNTTNPYGKSKYMIEQILKDLYISDNSFQIAILRYFNPVGAHESGTIGENPNGIPNNIMPFISQVAMGKRNYLFIFGNDYNTPDGTGIRDYIHVSDLSIGHVKAIDYLNSKKEPPLVVNLGTGKGYSVLQLVKTFEKVSGKKIPYKIVARRAGDVDICYADSSYAKEKLNWEVEKTIDDMCTDAWNWQNKNPNGYDKEIV